MQSKLTTLQQTVDDTAYTQQWQRQEFEASQLQSAQSVNVPVSLLSYCYYCIIFVCVLLMCCGGMITIYVYDFI